MTISRGVLAALWSLTALVAAREAQGRTDEKNFTAQLDLRLVASDALPSFTGGGLGLTRFDDKHEGLQLGRAFLEYRGHLSQTLDAHVTLDAYGDADKNPLDVSEAYLQWRPWPRNGWRWRVRAGAYYPAISLENTAAGWNSAYTLSPSAINTWIAEEVRAVGTEATATWLGSRTGHAFDLSLTGGIYAWNDPAGVLIFQRGWALHDRQTALFGGLPQAFPNGTLRHRLEWFHEIDGRPGYYLGAQAVYPERVTLRFMHYDNRGDPGAANEYENAWLTRFNSAGAQIQLPKDCTLIGQWMTGYTSVGASADGLGFLSADYDAWFVLASHRFDKHRLSARFDDFRSDSERGAQFFDGHQDGRAGTLAYTYTRDGHWQLVMEAMRIDSRMRQRPLLGLPERAVERTLQLALRYTL